MHKIIKIWIRPWIQKIPKSDPSPRTDRTYQVKNILKLFFWYLKNFIEPEQLKK